MLLTIALLAAPAQCPPGGVCPAGPVARTVRYVASVPARLTAQSMPLPMDGVKWPATASNPATGPKVGKREFVSLRRAGEDRWYLGRFFFRQFR